MFETRCAVVSTLNVRETVLSLAFLLLCLLHATVKKKLFGVPPSKTYFIQPAEFYFVDICIHYTQCLVDWWATICLYSRQIEWQGPLAVTYVVIHIDIRLFIVSVMKFDSEKSDHQNAFLLLTKTNFISLHTLYNLLQFCANEVDTTEWKKSYNVLCIFKKKALDGSSKLCELKLFRSFINCKIAFQNACLNSCQTTYVWIRLFISGRFVTCHLFNRRLKKWTCSWLNVLSQ